MNEFCVAEPPQVYDLVLAGLALLGGISKAQGVKAIVTREAVWQWQCKKTGQVMLRAYNVCAIPRWKHIWRHFSGQGALAPCSSAGANL